MPKAETNPPAALKLFIVGPARSGTSITYQAARRVFGLPGRGESHVFPLYQKIHKQYFAYAAEFRDKTGTLARELNPRAFKLHVQEHIRAFYRTAYDGDSFVDKTPGAQAVEGVNFILQVFPDARILATTRTGIEVVRSHMIKFSSTFEHACNAWAECMAAIVWMRQRCPQMLEVDQFDMTNDPQGLAARLCAHVGLPEKASALARHFIEQRHGTSSTHDWRQRQLLADTGWNERERESFTRICGPMMRKYGYPM